MHEFDSVSVSSYEASSLAAKLTEKSGDGWDVVAIVPSGSEITAYLKRERSESTSEATAASEPAAATAVSEPAGWATAPESTAAAAAGSSWGTSSADTSSTWGGSTTPAATPAAAPAAPAAPTTPAVPAGWYADPANRYELRYWDGSAWTEHVSRAGQQYTDPPVA
jgi:Protein of unknown function (DUF2510)